MNLRDVISKTKKKGGEEEIGWKKVEKNREGEMNITILLELHV